VHVFETCTQLHIGVMMLKRRVSCKGFAHTLAWTLMLGTKTHRDSAVVGVSDSRAGCCTAMLVTATKGSCNACAICCIASRTLRGGVSRRFGSPARATMAALGGSCKAAPSASPAARSLHRSSVQCSKQWCYTGVPDEANSSMHIQAGHVRYGICSTGSAWV
jgi:hypothetical protein